MPWCAGSMRGLQPASLLSTVRCRTAPSGEPGGPRWSGSAAKRDTSNEDTMIVRKPPRRLASVPFGLHARAGAIVLSVVACSRAREPSHLFACGPVLCATGIEFCEYARPSVAVPGFAPPGVVAPSVGGQAACASVPAPCHSDPTCECVLRDRVASSCTESAGEVTVRRSGT